MRSIRWLVALAVLFASVTVRAQVSAPERDALIALYNSTGGPSWYSSSGWLGAAGTECSWRGVVCDAARSMVITLDLEANRLRGALPGEVGNLTHLTELTLGSNSGLTGRLPATIGRLTALRKLDLNSNEMSGPLPAEFANLKALQYIDFESNSFEGPLPDALASMMQLEHFDIRFNRFEGRVPDFTQLPHLTFLGLGGYEQLECGHVLSNIGRLKNLTFLNLGSCNISGPLPFDQLLTLPLTHVGFDFNHLGGTVPREFAQMPALRELDLAANAYDTMPDEILRMQSLWQLSIPFNRFSGPLLPFQRLTNLENLSLTGNQFTGEIPPDWPTTLQLIFVDWNHLSGPLPDLTRFPKLGAFAASGNDFSGTIPAAYGGLQRLFYLVLDSNRLTGTIPPELSRPMFMFFLDLKNNALSGEVPSELMDAPLVWLKVRNNRLRASDPGVAAFVDDLDPGWLDTQTLPPASLGATQTSAFAAAMSWERLRNESGPGGVQISVSTTSGGPYVPLAMTSSKSATSVLVSGLKPQTPYFTVARAVTFANGLQANTLFSDPSAEVTFTTKEAVASPAQIAAVTVPSTLTQEPNSGGGTSSYRIANIGGTAATVTMTQSGDFFTQSPSSFTIAPGGSQIVTLTGVAKVEDVYKGESMADGGAAGKLTVAVRLLSARPSTVGPKLTLSARRIDLVTTPSNAATGAFTATNAGDETFVGVVSADVDWISAPGSLLRIAPGERQTVTFVVDPKKRPDPALLTGTVTGTLTLVSIFRPFSAEVVATGEGTTAATITVSLTTVVDPTHESVPPLPAGQVAYFLPGVGNVLGRVGLFLSDLSLLNASGTKPVEDVKLYYTAIGSSSSPLVALVSSMPVGSSVFVGDVVKNVFGGEAQVGALQIRSSLWDQLSISANVLNVSSAAGTYGTSIPVFRSDRSAALFDSVWLTGLRKDASGYTNLFLQETAGSSGTLTIEMFDENGRTLSSRDEQLGAYETKQINDIVPDGGVAARITGTSGLLHFHAFATPVDAASGDNWSVADWSRQYAYDSFEPVVIPIAGGSPGAAGTNFRTDVAITSTNPVCVPPSTRMCGRNDVVLTYYTIAGQTFERTVTLDRLETKRLDDIASATFGASGTVGWIAARPLNGTVAVASRTYNLVAGSGSTYGSAVATIASSRALRPGQVQRFAGITDDPSSETGAKRAATYRNNIGIVEVSGEPAQVRVTLSYLDSRGTKVSAFLEAQKEFSLAPHQIVLVPLTASVIGASRDELGTLRNVRVDIEVIGATGAVVSFISSVDNGTGDSIIRTE